MTEEPRLSAAQLREDRIPLLKAVWQAWVATLPDEAATNWRRGCAYVRESSIKSLATNAPDMQLRNTLAMLGAKHVYVPWEGVFFDNASGTDTAPRSAFRRLFEEAVAGGFQVVGVFVSERLFRNLEQATRYKREFRLKGIELEYLGKFEGDPRNPASWQLEVIQDMTAELQARNTGFYVGTHIEALTRSGHPVGMLPEAYEIAERAPTFLGRRGSPIAWRFVEPLASIIAEGRRRYMAGSSYADLARWAATTELEGRTPKGSTMNAWWWTATLHNPKYAGYHMPTAYQGFKPGVESPKRPRRNRHAELVPCKLPALWTLDDYYAIFVEGERRLSNAKVRKTYRSYLLTGVAVDARCQHGMSVHHKERDGRFWMVCRHLETHGRHNPMIRADAAEAELDELLGAISLDDEQLGRLVEEELRELARAEGGEREQFRSNPAIAGLRRALVELTAVGLDDLNLRRQLTELEQADEARRQAICQPVRDFRAARERLRNWSDVWHGADMTRKNELLREAGVRVEIGRDEDDDTGPAHIRRISAENPVFELALATALAKRERGFEEEEGCSTSNPRVTLALEGRLAPIVGLALAAISSGGAVLVTRPAIREGSRRPKRRPKEDAPRRVTPLVEWGPPSGDYLSLLEVAEICGTTNSAVGKWIRQGRLPAVRRGAGSGRLYVHRDDLAQFSRPPRGRPARQAA